MKAAHRIYFVSATFSEVAKEVIETSLCKSSDTVPTIIPPSPVEVVKGGSLFNVTPSLTDTNEEMWKTAIEAIKLKMATLPCVVFMANTEDPKSQELKDIAPKHCFWRCDT